MYITQLQLSFTLKLTLGSFFLARITRCIWPNFDSLN